MNITANESKTEIHLTGIDSKQLYAALLEEINATYDVILNVGGEK